MYLSSLEWLQLLLIYFFYLSCPSLDHLQSFTFLQVYSDLHLPLFLTLTTSLTSACIPVMGYCFSNLADRGTIFMYCFPIFISHAHTPPWSATHMLLAPHLYEPHLLAPLAAFAKNHYCVFFFGGRQMRARK